MRRRGLHKSGGGVAIPTGNLVLYNRFNNSVADETGNHTLTNNGVAYTTGLFSGVANESAQWASGTDYITIPDNDLLSFGNGTTDSPFSVSFGVYFDSDGAGSVNVIINKRQFTTLREWQVQRRISDGALQVRLWDQSTLGAIGQSATGLPLSNATNYQVVCTYDGSGTASGIKIYIDGVLSTLTDFSTGSYTAMENGTSLVALGATAWSLTNPDDRLLGKLDGLGVWDIELSQAEVTAIYNKQTGGNEIL